MIRILYGVWYVILLFSKTTFQWDSHVICELSFAVSSVYSFHILIQNKTLQHNRIGQYSIFKKLLLSIWYVTYTFIVYYSPMNRL